MKFLAILKDSLRETLDISLFFVMVGISLVTVVLVASISYDPVTVQRKLELQTGTLNSAIGFQLQARPDAKISFRVDTENFERLDQRAEPWLGDYRFDYVLRFSAADDGNPLTKANNEKALEELRREMRRVLRPEQLKEDFERRMDFKEVEVKEAESADPNVIRFQVATKGTKVKSRDEWFHEPSVLFGLYKIPVAWFTLEQMVRFVGDDIIGKWGSSFTLVISIIVTAFFLPSMLAKGTVDLLLVKPISRVTLLLYKFLGGLLFMFLNAVVILAGVWLVTGLRTGIWINSFLVCIFIFTFQFAIVYSVSAVLAVFTRSPIMSILAALALWVFLLGFGWAHYWVVEFRRENAEQAVREHPVYIGLDVMHAVLPRYKDIDWLTSKMIETETLKPRPQPAPDAGNAAETEAYEFRKKLAEETYEKQLKDLDKRYGAYDWTSSLTVSSIFILLMLGLACARFATRDY